MAPNNGVVRYLAPVAGLAPLTANVGHERIFEMSRVDIGAFLFPLCAVVIVMLATRTVQAEEPTKFLGSIWQNKNKADDALFGTVFDQITPENCGKWEAVERVRGMRVWTNVEAMVRFAGQRNMVVKHHGFVWGQQQPVWTQKAGDMTNAVDAMIEDFFSGKD